MFLWPCKRLALPTLFGAYAVVVLKANLFQPGGERGQSEGIQLWPDLSFYNVFFFFFFAFA